MTEKEKQYFEILMEEMNGKFSLVLEGHAAIRQEFKEQIDEIKEEQQLFKSLLQVSHEELKEEIQAVYKRSEARDAELKKEMAAGFNALGFKVEGHEDRIRFLERKVA